LIGNIICLQLEQSYINFLVYCNFSKATARNSKILVLLNFEFRVNTPRKQGGLGEMKIPLLADKSCAIARSYGVLKEEDGIPFRGLFIIDRNQIMRQITVNDLPVGRSVDETLRLVQAFMFTDEHGEGKWIS